MVINIIFRPPPTITPTTYTHPSVSVFGGSVQAFGHPPEVQPGTQPLKTDNESSAVASRGASSTPRVLRSRSRYLFPPHAMKAKITNEMSSAIQRRSPRTGTTTVCEKFDDYFDLTLHVGESPMVKFQVDSRCMRRACKPWQAMLYGNFSEQKPKTGDWIVSFPDDNIEYFRIVLHLIHGNITKVEKKPNVNYIYTLLDFIDKWDLFKLFEPWRDLWTKWLSSHESPLRQATALVNSQSLFIAWTFGSDLLIAPILQKLTRHSQLDHTKCLVLHICEHQSFFLDNHLNSMMFTCESPYILFHDVANSI